jgi:hypothetical protein
VITTETRSPRRLLGLALLAVLAGACASATAANSRSDPMPLAIPEPPPRLIEPLPEVAELPPPEPVRREPTPTVPRISRPARDNGAAGRSDPKPEPAKPAEPAPVVETAVTGPPAPRPELRTPETADEEEAARQVLHTLDRASKTLAKVDYRTLGKDGQEQYNTAKRFIDQAEEALRARNQIAAKYLADKADTIAKGLTGR